MRFSSLCRSGGVLVAVLLAAACDSAPTQVDTDASAISASAVLLECPASAPSTVTRTLGSLGGTIEVDGHSLTVPLGALSGLTEFTMTAPASRFVEVHVTANGSHGFQFLKTAVLTISYERCRRGDISGSLTAYKIDPESKVLLKKMDATDVRLLRRVIVATDSLSAYAIAQ